MTDHTLRRFLLRLLEHDHVASIAIVHQPFIVTGVAGPAYSVEALTAASTRLTLAGTSIDVIIVAFAAVRFGVAKVACDKGQYRRIMVAVLVES